MNNQTLDVGIKKYEYIDILRSVAILAVIAHHSYQATPGLSMVTSWIFNYGQLGVQLFFIASALTLCLSSSERREKYPINFYKRRFFRIAPLYYFGIVFYFIWRMLTNIYKNGNLEIPQGYTILNIIENIIFIHGFDPSNFNFIVPGGWSISTEMTFYLIFPFLFNLVERLSLKGFIFFSLSIAMLSFTIQYIIISMIAPILIEMPVANAIENNNGFGYIYALIINQINVFIIGMITFKLIRKKVTGTHLLLSIALIIISIFIQNNQIYKTGYDGFAYPIFSAIAFSIIAIKLSSTRIPNNIAYFALVKIGQNSFSMYIVHFFILGVLKTAFEGTIYKLIYSPELRLAIIFLFLVAVTYFTAKITNTYIEKPGINFGKRYIHSEV